MLLHKLKGDKRALSNVIVVVLSLILIVVIVSNVILWNYEMNQYDWERMREKIEIVDASLIMHTWYYSDFSYRVQHDIIGSVAGPAAEYQVRITIVNGTGTSEGEVYYTTNIGQPDFDDVRFTWLNNTSGIEQPIPYWREIVYEGVNATFWIKIPVIPANPDSATIYIYYGRDDVSTESNGDATFIFFDDFDDGIINATKWTNINDATESGGTLRGNGGNKKIWMETQQVFSAPFRVNFKMKGERNNDFDSGIQIGNLYFISDRGTSAPGIGTNWIYPSGSAGNVISWHVYEAVVLSSFQEFYDLTANKYTSASYSYITGPLRLIGDSDRQNRDTFYDWIFMRNYVNPEPTHGVWGDEETYTEESVQGEVRLKIRNLSALTAHVIALWINNVTLHKRYTVDIFISSSKTVTYSFADENLPTNAYVVKVVTERGNIAIYSLD